MKSWFRNTGLPDRNDDGVVLSLFLICIVFFLKALYLSFFVTPLWSIPDEIGHLAYTYDIATGSGIPLLGEAKISSEIMSSFKGIIGASPAYNWIAQHPPFYYLIAAIPLKIGMIFTDNNEILFKLPRIVSALSGSLVIATLFYTFRLVKLSGYKSLLLAASIGFIPMFTHLSSGTNHDTTLFLLSALGVYFFVKYLVTKDIKSAYWMALWFTLASAVKMTAWVILPPVLFFVFIYTLLIYKRFTIHLLTAPLLTLLAPILWMARNIYYFGNPFYTAVDFSHSWRLEQPLTDTFAQYINSQPVIEHFLLNFYGLLGWHHHSIAGNAWFQVANFPRLYFAISFLIFSFILVFFLFSVVKDRLFTHYRNKLIFEQSSFINMNSNIKNIIILVFLIVGLLVSIFIYINSHSGGFPSKLFVTGSALLIGLGFISIGLILYAETTNELIFMIGMITFAFFTIILLQPLYEAYLLDGRMRATHGRYFYPVMPFVLMAFAVAIERIKLRSAVLLLLVSGLIIMELDSYILQAIPFYWSFK